MGQGSSKRRSFTPGRTKNTEIATQPLENGDTQNGSVHQIRHDDDEIHIQGEEPSTSATLTSELSRSPSAPTGKTEKQKRFRVGFPFRRSPSGRWSRKKKTPAQNGVRPSSFSTPLKDKQHETVFKQQSLPVPELDVPDNENKIEAADIVDNADKKQSELNGKDKTNSKPSEKTKGRRGSQKSSGKKKKKDKQNSKQDKKKKKQKSSGDDPSSMVQHMDKTDAKVIQEVEPNEMKEKETETVIEAEVEKVTSLATYQQPEVDMDMADSVCIVQKVNSAEEGKRTDFYNVKFNHAQMLQNITHIPATLDVVYSDEKDNSTYKYEDEKEVVLQKLETTDEATSSVATEDTANTHETVLKYTTDMDILPELQFLSSDKYTFAEHLDESDSVERTNEPSINTTSFSVRGQQAEAYSETKEIEFEINHLQQDCIIKTGVPSASLDIDANENTSRASACPDRGANSDTSIASTCPDIDASINASRAPLCPHPDANNDISGTLVYPDLDAKNDTYRASFYPDIDTHKDTYVASVCPDLDANCDTFRVSVYQDIGASNDTSKASVRPVTDASNDTFRASVYPDIDASNDTFRAPVYPDIDYSNDTFRALVYPDIDASNDTFRASVYPDIDASNDTFRAPVYPDTGASNDTFRASVYPDIDASNDTFRASVYPDTGASNDTFRAPVYPDIDVNSDTSMTSLVPNNDCGHLEFNCGTPVFSVGFKPEKGLRDELNDSSIDEHIFIGNAYSGRPDVITHINADVSHSNPAETDQIQYEDVDGETTQEKENEVVAKETVALVVAAPMEIVGGESDYEEMEVNVVEGKLEFINDSGKTVSDSENVDAYISKLKENLGKTSLEVETIEKQQEDTITEDINRITAKESDITEDSKAETTERVKGEKCMKIPKKLSNLFHKTDRQSKSVDSKDTETHDADKEESAMDYSGSKVSSTSLNEEQLIENRTCPVEETSTHFCVAANPTIPDKANLFLDINLESQVHATSTELSPNSGGTTSISTSSLSPTSPTSCSSRLTSPSSDSDKNETSGFLKRISIGSRLRTAILRKKSSGASESSKEEKRISLTRPRSIETTDGTQAQNSLHPRAPVVPYSPMTEDVCNDVFSIKSQSPLDTCNTEPGPPIQSKSVESSVTFTDSGVADLVSVGMPETSTNYTEGREAFTVKKLADDFSGTEEQSESPVTGITLDDDDDDDDTRPLSDAHAERNETSSPTPDVKNNNDETALSKSEVGTENVAFILPLESLNRVSRELIPTCVTNTEASEQTPLQEIIHTNRARSPTVTHKNGDSHETEALEQPDIPRTSDSLDLPCVLGTEETESSFPLSAPFHSNITEDHKPTSIQQTACDTFVSSEDNQMHHYSEQQISEPPKQYTHEDGNQSLDIPEVIQSNHEDQTFKYESKCEPSSKDNRKLHFLKENRVGVITIAEYQIGVTPDPHCGQHELRTLQECQTGVCTDHETSSKVEGHLEAAYEPRVQNCRLTKDHDTSIDNSSSERLQISEGIIASNSFLNGKGEIIKSKQTTTIIPQDVQNVSKIGEIPAAHGNTIDNFTNGHMSCENGRECLLRSKGNGEISNVSFSSGSTNYINDSKSDKHQEIINVKENGNSNICNGHNNIKSTIDENKIDSEDTIEAYLKLQLSHNEIYINGNSHHQRSATSDTEEDNFSESADV